MHGYYKNLEDFFLKHPIKLQIQMPYFFLKHPIKLQIQMPC